MVPPNHLSNLTHILTQMRVFHYILAGDITEMFLQIRLHPDDRPCHRFTHRGPHYQWTRALFGNKASPNMSQKVLHTLCIQEENLDQAKETVSRSCYMDDCINSWDSIQEITELARQLPRLLSQAGMKICKIYSNCREALEEVPPNLRPPESISRTGT